MTHDEPFTLDSASLRRCLNAASDALLRAKGRVDALNVYPVPDGDTGTNMSGTFREAVAVLNALPEDATVAQSLDALARGALYGARGNSGVILSQALRGLARGAAEPFDGAALTAALGSAADAAYSAVAKPVEGTMLTVLRAAARGAKERGGTSIAQTLRAAVEVAAEAEAHTIDQLPALKEAGVTDAGGEGICVILRALLASATGQPAAPEDVEAVQHVPVARLAGHRAEEFGFCTEFVIEPAGGELDMAAVRSLAETQRSAVVVGDANAMRIHVHSDDPDAVLRRAEALGRVSRVKVEDMAAQFTRYEASGSGAGAKVAVLALAPGAGMRDVFSSLGARVMDTHDDLKPSAGSIASAADALRIPDVIVLPNHKDVVLAARQAVGLARCTLTVVPTVSVPQGMAAMLAFDPDSSVADSFEAMGQAYGVVRTVEVTNSATERKIEGIEVHAGEPIALLDGRLVAKSDTMVGALIAGLRAANPEAGALVTLYGGEGATPSELGAAGAAIGETFAGVEVQTLAGGQPLYPFVASIE